MQLEGMSQESIKKGREGEGRAKNGIKKGKNERVYLLGTIVVLVAVASLGFGIIEGLSEKSAGSGGLIISSVPLEHPSSATLNAAQVSNTGEQNNAIPSGGEVVGNKATHEYELPWCQPQVSAIGQSNEAWFASASAAKSAGYTADPTCAGNE